MNSINKQKINNYDKVIVKKNKTIKYIKIMGRKSNRKINNYRLY